MVKHYRLKGGYSCDKPVESLPKIISTNGTNNIAAIKSYFTDEQVIRSIANLTGMDFDVLTDGDYRLLLEPIAYYKFEGVMIATCLVFTLTAPLYIWSVVGI
jgi:hypothetical protein